MKRRVVVTGVGAVTSLSQQTEDRGQKVLGGESGVHPLRVFDASEFKVRFWRRYDDGARSCLGEGSQTTRPIHQFAPGGGIDAVGEAGIDFSKEDPFRCGVILGSGIGFGLNEIETQHSRLLAEGANKVSAFTIPKLMVNAASGQVSIEFGIRGPNYVVVIRAPPAQRNAIGDAFKAIQHDDADVMITGGSEAAITPMGISGFANETSPVAME